MQYLLYGSNKFMALTVGWLCTIGVTNNPDLTEIDAHKFHLLRRIISNILAQTLKIFGACLCW
jgi:hypothetical protein